jgi:hypothetical protein
MKLTTAFAVVLLLAGLCCKGQSASDGAISAKSIPGYTIKISPPSDQIRLGSPINIKATVTNISGSDIYWDLDRSSDSVYKAFRILLMKDGHEVEMTFFHRKVTGRQRPDDPDEVETGSSIAIAHPPGLMFTVELDLRRLYKITKPGIYTLTLSRAEEDNKTVVHSNTVTLDIVP